VLDLLDQIVRRAESGEPLVACTLVATRGSTPQKAPALMMVLADGRTLGTIGGGCVEAEVRSRALWLLAARRPPASPAPAPSQPAPASGLPAPASGGSVLTFRLDQDLGWDDGLVCGGTMDVAVHVVASAADAAAFRAARDALAAGAAATLDLSAADAAGRLARFSLPLDPRPTLIIAGAGHVGLALAAVAAVAGFDVTVVDDRPDLASAARFPGARLVVGEIDVELARLLPDEPAGLAVPVAGGGSPAPVPRASAADDVGADRPGLGGTGTGESGTGGAHPEEAGANDARCGAVSAAHAYVVIVTRGHRHDAAALAAVVRSPARYVGLIGSRRKVATIFRDLHSRGVPVDLLRRVRAPVGLDVGAVTPGEIAVSIVAELVAARRAGPSRPGGPAAEMRLSAGQLDRLLSRRP
jgi:xanthine dehydrogenase accessory factor